MSAESDVPEAMLGWQSAEVLVRGHGEGQESALRELGITVDEIDWARGVIDAARIERVHDPKTQPTLATIVCLAAAVRDVHQPAPFLWELARAIEWAVSEIARLNELVELHTSLARCAQAQASNALGEIDEFRVEMDELRAAHARERDGLLGDKKHLHDELDAMRDRAMRAEAFVEKFEPLLRAYHAGADRNQLKAACAERWGESTSVTGSDLRGLAEREAAR